MNSSGYHEMKVPETERHTINRKIHAHDRLESARDPFDQGFRKGRKFNTGHYIVEILGLLSQWPNGVQLKQLATSENCWCMRTMRTRIPPSYQLNILTGIE
jgi:hypothetical protein